MPELTVHTLKRVITIRPGGDPAFQFLACAPSVSTELMPASIDVEREGAFLSTAWRGLAPAFLTRVSSARDLVLQLDSEFFELTLRDAAPATILSATILCWRSRRLLLLGPVLARTALALTLFQHEFDIEGDWASRFSSAGFTALPRSVRWDARLLRAYPQVYQAIQDIPVICADSFHGELSAWCPQTEARPWLCRDGTLDGIIIADDNAGGRSQSRRIAPEFAWGHLMAARATGAGGLDVMVAIKNIAMATPALKVSVGDLDNAADRIMEFSRTLQARNSLAKSVAQGKEV